MWRTTRFSNNNYSFRIINHATTATAAATTTTTSSSSSSVSHFHSNILCLLTQGEVCLWLFVFVSGVGVVLASLALDWCSGMVSDGFRTQKKVSWIPGKERSERVLASAISIDGRKEWTCKFCSESDVWTRWRCRRCCFDIPAGLRGSTGRRSTQELENGPRALRRQAGRKTESPKVWRLKIRSLGRGLRPWRRRGEGAQALQGLPARRESGMEEECGVDMDLEDEVESRKKLDEQ